MPHRIIGILLFIFFGNIALAQYSIKGKVNLNEDWQPKIFMAAVNKLSDYYRTSYDMIVSTADINPDGSFLLEGNNLPNEGRYYRLYLMKKQNTDYDACLYFEGEDHNFVHILLQNGEAVEITADPNSFSPFGNYKINGLSHNHMMRDLSNIMFPSFYFSRIKFPTERKFEQDKLHKNLKNFIDTCSNTLVCLAAINNMEFDEYFDRSPEYFEDFGKRLKAKLPNSIYTKNYLLKVKYYANEDFGFPTWAKVLLGLLTLGISGLVLLLSKANNKIKNLENQLAKPSTETPPTTISIEDILTQKEKEILQLISQGKSNKEIANSLFVELSTVKTHINKIYSKIGASNRKEAQTIARQAFQKGV